MLKAKGFRIPGSQIHRPDPVALSAAVLSLASCAALPFASLKESRLATGQGLNLLQSGSFGLFVCLLWAIVLLLCFLRSRTGYLTQACLTLGGLFSLLFWATAQGAAAREAKQMVVWISLGPAFWLSLFAAYVLLSNAWRKLGPGFCRLAIYFLLAFFALALVWHAGLEALSLSREYLQRQEKFWTEVLNHVFIAGTSSAGAILLGIPLGLLAYFRRLGAGRLFFFLNMLQTVPSLALFGILVAPMAFLAKQLPFLQQAGIQGIGWAPAVLALILYCLLPIVRNTYVGFQSVDQDTMLAGQGMGMTSKQLLLQVQLPVVSPVVLGGIRVAAVQAIGNTAVAALIGAGGLGAFIFQGLGQGAAELILLGALPTILLALVCDVLFRVAIAALTPKGLRQE
ncbi:MAG: ABC transporter permease [Desulfohalobiaceae bacterium]